VTGRLQAARCQEKPGVRHGIGSEGDSTDTPTAYCDEDNHIEYFMEMVAECGGATNFRHP